MTETIAAALHALEAPGSFAVRLRVPADELQLSVTRVGSIDFPITPTTVKRLLTVASRSPFGRGEQTLVDPNVRSGWEVAKSRVKIAGRRWNPVLRGILDALREQLGAPGHLHASLDKLTIYGPGEFFKPHQDTEKNTSMIGTLVVLLPSRFSGGALKIDRQGQKLEFRRTAKAAEELELLAFYADCHHEIRPVKTGYRVALVYQLGVELDAAAPAKTAALEAGQIAPLERAVAAHFSTPLPVRYARDRRTFIPEKLVYLLDHQYTPQSLAWTKLKHADALRAAALREVASTLDLDLHLALADIREIWQCTPTVTHGRWSRWAYTDSDDADGYELECLIDAGVMLHHWQSAAGEHLDHDALPVADEELCFTTANDDLHPFASEYEGYMGNYGETLERWYHRAAIVAWPTANAFIVEAQLDPRAAVEQLTDELERPQTRAAGLERLERLLEVWRSCVGHGPSSRPLVEALKLARLIEDESLAAALLEPLKPELMPGAAVRPLLELAAHHGLDWCQRRLDSWHSRVWNDQSWQTTYPREWLAKLADADGELGLELARFVATRQWREVRTQLSSLGPARLRSPFLDLDRRVQRSVVSEVVEVLHAAVITKQSGIIDEAIAVLLSDDSPLSTVELVELVELARNVAGVDQIAKHCHEHLEATLAEPARASNDWSIVVPRTCKCDDCATLHKFLESNEIHMSWPLAKRRRQHIHGAIDGKRLPVTHTTTRAGRPHKLELTKSRELAKLEAKLRRVREQALARVRDGR